MARTACSENPSEESSRDSISGTKNSPHPITAWSLSLQAPPVMESGPNFARRSRRTKKREGKTHSLICFNTEGKHLEDLMWVGPDFGAFSG